MSLVVMEALGVILGVDAGTDADVGAVVDEGTRAAFFEQAIKHTKSVAVRRIPRAA